MEFANETCTMHAGLPLKLCAHFTSLLCNVLLCYRREQQYSEKVDVYSFGIILWELITRQNPFEEFRPKYKFNTQLEAAIMNGLRYNAAFICVDAN